MLSWPLGKSQDHESEQLNNVIVDGRWIYWEAMVFVAFEFLSRTQCLLHWKNYSSKDEHAVSEHLCPWMLGNDAYAKCLVCSAMSDIHVKAVRKIYTIAFQSHVLMGCTQTWTTSSAYDQDHRGQANGGSCGVSVSLCEVTTDAIGSVMFVGALDDSANIHSAPSCGSHRKKQSSQPVTNNAV